MQIRRAEPKDARGILEAHRRAVRELAAEAYDSELLEVWAPPVDEERVESFVDSKFGEGAEPILFVAVEGERRYGFSEVLPSEEYLHAVYVDPDRARSGVGRSLLRRAEWAAVHEGAERLELDSSLNAVEFYEQHGYMRIEETVLRMGEGMELPCVRMEKQVSGTGIKTDVEPQMWESKTGMDGE